MNHPATPEFDPDLWAKAVLRAGDTDDKLNDSLTVYMLACSLLSEQNGAAKERESWLRQCRDARERVRQACA